jgi:hypothetical protein
VGGRVALKAGIDQAKGRKFRHGKVAGAGQSAVEDGRNMAVAQKEQVLAAAVHTEGRRIVAEYVEVERGEKLSAAHGSAGVARLRLVHHAQDVAANLRGVVVD